MSQIQENIKTTRIPITRGEAINITIDGQTVEAFAGETVATVLLVSGFSVFQQTEESQLPRSLYCGMGVCFNCLVTVDGLSNIRACITPVADGMVIETRGDHLG